MSCPEDVAPRAQSSTGSEVFPDHHRQMAVKYLLWRSLEIATLRKWLRGPCVGVECPTELALGTRQGL